METYEFGITCTNCQHHQQWDIPKGTTIDDFGRQTDCPVCGCKLFKGDPSWWISHPGWTYDMPCVTTTNVPENTWSGYGDLPSAALGQ